MLPIMFETTNSRTHENTFTVPWLGCNKVVGVFYITFVYFSQRGTCGLLRR